MKNLVLIVISLFCVEYGFSQIQYSSQNTAPTDFIQNLSGPRVGITVVTNGLISEAIESNFMTQFGYQYEKQIMGDENVAGLVEGILFIGGLEKGKFIPSISGMFGARFASGTEFAIGPNISASEDDLNAALVIGFGKTIKAGNLNIPINFAWVPSVKRTETDDVEDCDEPIQTTETTGHRFTVTIGFNFRK